MRRLVRIVLVIQLFALPFCLIPSLASAGGDRGQERANSLEAGSWSMQFGITDELGLKPFNGMSLSLKRHTSARSAFRLGLNLGFDSDDDNFDQVRSDADSTIYADVDKGDSNSQLVQVDFLYVRYVNPGASANLFLGTGPLFRYSRTESNGVRSSLVPGAVAAYIRENWSRTWKVGVLGAGGVEWFATKTISFHAEYRVAFAYGESKGKSVTDNIYSDRPNLNVESHASGSSWGFNGSSVIFGISLYF